MQKNFENKPMQFVSFDTHKYVKELEASGFNERQAEVIVKSLLESRDYDLSKLSTHEQVAQIERDIDLIRKDIEIIHKDMEKFATREQLLELKAELKEEMHSTTKELIQEISKSKSETLKWVVGLFIALVIAIIVRPYFH